MQENISQAPTPIERVTRGIKVGLVSLTQLQSHPQSERSDASVVGLLYGSEPRRAMVVVVHASGALGGSMDQHNVNWK